jgi:hypothetical protein
VYLIGMKINSAVGWVKRQYRKYIPHTIQLMYTDFEFIHVWLKEKLLQDTLYIMQTQNITIPVKKDVCIKES